MKILAELILLSVAATVMGVILVMYPLALIWCLNTLFTLSIPYTWQTWLAGVGLMTFLNGLGAARFDRKAVDKQS